MTTDRKTTGTGEEWLAVIHWNELDKGGHFATFEQPAPFTPALRGYFRGARGA